MSVLVVPNATRPASVEAAAHLTAFLAEHAIAVVMQSSDLRATPVQVPVHEVSSTDALPEHVELAVAIGGDGTILKAVHLVGRAQVPVLGVKLGRLGFLAGCEPARMTDAVLAALANEADVEERAVVEAVVRCEDGSEHRMFALNEVVAARGASGRVIGFSVSVDGEPLASMRGDGVLVATATGSTGYALSAGGPVVSPGFGGLVVVPIAPHTLHARSVVTAPSDTVDIDLSDDPRGDAVLFVDGEPAELPSRPLRVSCTASPAAVSLVRYEGRSFYSTVSSVFFGGA